eukprot:TRINITY_DN2914_c0_g1_i5.p1 TRINITY_DN2914_c0_g1~~TRINITY_DN2914_c0_g1_i5.p1  ORF type:complete len:328 (-),score=13.65 TRINITY_DN2914_c0_g1_i5:296-1165(-)
MNIFALFFNLSLVISIWRLKEKRTSTEILIGGLSSGIIVGALGCGPQCLLSAIAGTFAYGDRACFAEAYLHLVGMEIQFICVAAISHRTYVGVVKLQSYPPIKSLLVVAFAWAFAFFTTSFMGYFSSFYLVASGTFCFYDWTSPALIFAAWPMAAVSLGLMGFWYWKTYQAFQTVRDGAKEFRQDAESASLDRALAIRLSDQKENLYHFCLWMKMNQLVTTMTMAARNQEEFLIHFNQCIHLQKYLANSIFRQYKPLMKCPHPMIPVLLTPRLILFLPLHLPTCYLVYI